MSSDILFFSVNSVPSIVFDKFVLGGKGAGLCEMTALSIPVPPGFIISTNVSKRASKCNYDLGTKFYNEVCDNIKLLENDLDRSFGGYDNHKMPLILSVRSGAPISMPGMMDTVLNLGVNDQTVSQLAKMNDRFAYDSYRRFIQMYGNVVLGIDSIKFEDTLLSLKAELKIQDDCQLGLDSLKKLIKQYKNIIYELAGEPFPEDVYEQLYNTIGAVFKSWNNDRAYFYRKMNNISHELGTAVVVQAMVYGNLNDQSGSGVLFSRNPSDGSNNILGEYLINAQGEDIVSGIRTPISLEEMKKRDSHTYDDIFNIAKKLELHYKDLQDIEFTIQDNVVWILQTRSGKRSSNAAIKIAVDLCKEGLISKKEAIKRVSIKDLECILHPTIDYDKNSFEILARGLPASPGAVSGHIVFTASDAIDNPSNFDSVILVRKDTSPEDIEGMYSAKGIVTVNGGMTSHAAVVARGMGKSCVCGVGDINIDSSDKFFTTSSGKVLRYGDRITIDGSKGYIISGTINTNAASFSFYAKEFISWLDDFQSMGVRVNSDTIEDTELALSFGAAGVGLCRTEHMFFAKDRINIIREMIIAEDKKSREKALKRLLPMQKNDFKGILSLLKDKKLNVRLLDPPLHEFLPKDDESIKALSINSGISIQQIKDRICFLHESNPMLGSRGCRVAIKHPEIYIMQVEALMSAINELYDVTSRQNFQIEIMIPFTIKAIEFKIIRDIIKSISDKYNIKCLIGTMIENPSAVINAEEIALYADFFSFGTNDLTQTILALSRDDTASLINDYIDRKIFLDDPFKVIDVDSVGEFIKIAVKKAKKANPNIKIGLCGEQGGDLKSLQFLNTIEGIDYVSCSTYRVPTAKLILAHLNIGHYST